MFNLRKVALGTSAALIAFATAASAQQTKSITLCPALSVKTSGAMVTVSGKITNKGDTMADKVHAVIEPPMMTPMTNDLGHLDPLVTKTWECSFTGETYIPGEHQLVIRIMYTDAGGHQFDTVATHPYILGEIDSVPTIATALTVPVVKTPDVEDPERGPSIAQQELISTIPVTLRVMPIEKFKKPVTLYPQILLSSSLGLLDGYPLEPITVSTSTVSRTYTITNLSARVGSRIPAFMILDSDSNDRHISTSAFVQINIGGFPPDGENVPDKLPIKPDTAFAFCFLLIALSFLPFQRFFDSKAVGALIDMIILGAIVVLLASQLNIPLLFTDTTVVGGDNPAHHYLASHLGDTLRTGGIASWADGWWCGFPMFRFYFPLPYIFMALLHTVIPHNIAFKLVSVLGLFLIPFSAYAGGRVIRLPRPYPALFAIATIPVLFDTAHTMWGGNIYSALSGMISCSYGFAFFPIALACAARDSVDCRPRPITVILLVLMALSHFFTACIAGLVLASLFFGMLASRFFGNRFGIRSAMTLIPIGILTFLSIAWWLLPLYTLKPWSVDFGDQWPIDFWGSLPSIIRYSFIPALLICVGLICVPRTRMPPRWKLFASLHCVILLFATFLFFKGSEISKVFVNCRMWPFIVYSASVTSVLALGAVLSLTKSKSLAVLGIAFVVFAFAWDGDNHVSDWSRYNFKGFEALSEADVVTEIANDLRGTAGRLEYDLHVGNEQLGSSRIFEIMPFLCGKAILEGGIVNSALGSMAAYSVQGRVSDNTAGFPNDVTPLSFDPSDGFRRLELYGVKHFVARSTRTQDALLKDSAWKQIRDYGKWMLFENTTIDGNIVRVFDSANIIKTYTPKHEIDRWLSTPHSYSKPFAISNSEGIYPPEVIVTDKKEPGWLDKLVKPVETLERTSKLIKFRTSAIGKPHYIAISFMPNWKVKGAKKIYLASSGHMIVFPEDEFVELEYQTLPIQSLGYVLTVIGLLYLIIWMHAERR